MRFKLYFILLKYYGYVNTQNSIINYCRQHSVHHIHYCPQYGGILDTWTMKSKVEDFFQKNADVIGGRKKSAKPKPQTPLKKLNPLTDTPSFRYRGVNRPKRPPDLPRQPTLPDIADRDHSAKSGHHKTQLERTHTQLSHGRGTLTRIAETEETSHGESLPDISGAKTTTAKQTGSNKKVHTLVLPPIKTGKTSDHDGHNSSADQ